MLAAQRRQHFPLGGSASFLGGEILEVSNAQELAHRGGWGQAPRPEQRQVGCVFAEEPEAQGTETTAVRLGSESRNRLEKVLGARLLRATRIPDDSH